MHTNQATVFACDGHRFENCAIVHEKHAGIGHKQFEAGHALIYQRFQFRQAFIGQIGADQMKAVIGRRFAFGFCEPDIQRFVQSLAFVLHGEVNNGRRPAKRSRTRACLEIIG